MYTAIYAHASGELRRQLIACLRQGKRTRRPRSVSQDRRGRIPEMVSIHVRPPEVEDRVMPGHWEGDLIKGAANRSAVGVLVERSTRLVLLAKMEDATAESALRAFSAKLNAIAEPLRQTLTYDQGREMAAHRAHGREGLLLRSAPSLAARHLREHQWAAAPVLGPWGRTCRCTPRTTSTPLPTRWTTGPVPPMTGVLRWRSMARYWPLTLNAPPQPFNDAGERALHS
jgi:hypothetical protein